MSRIGTGKDKGLYNKNYAYYTAPCFDIFVIIIIQKIYSV